MIDSTSMSNEQLSQVNKKKKKNWIAVLYSD